MMTLSLCRCIIATLLSLLCVGCLAAPFKEPFPQGVTVRLVAERLLPKSPVSISPDGSLLAVVRSDGLYLRPLAGGEEKKVDAGHPLALAFNPEGTELVAAYVSAEGSRLQRYATHHGELLSEISLPGRCEALLSREGEWLAFVSTRQLFSFGGSIRSRLLRWDGLHAPSESLLSDTNLDRSTLAAEDGLQAIIQPQLSPHGDEILFLRLHDPPAFDPNVVVVLRHIETASDRTVAKLPYRRSAAIYLDGGELVAYGDGINQFTIIDPWRETVVTRAPRPGAILAAPVSGDIIWVDNSLLRRDGQHLLSAAKAVQPVSFLADGRLVLREKNRLWLLDNLPVTSSRETVPDSEELLLLRKWRAEGLIDLREYAERIGK